jgi:ABC-type nitrate/sulfonate/bicarbonate transport system substrate-binding protein
LPSWRVTRKHPLRIASSANPGYAPQYVASALGFFDRHGLDVTFLPQTPPGSTRIVETLTSGAADLVLSSVLAAVRLSREGLDPVLVCQSNQHIHHGFLARPGHLTLPFGWEQLRSSTLILHPTHIATPFVAFRELLWQKNIPLDDVALIVGLTASEALAEFRRGLGTFLVCDLDTVDGAGLAEVARVSEGLGPIPWSVYCTTREAALRHGESIVGFRASIAAAVRWLYATGAAEAGEAIAPFFKDIPVERLVARLQRAISARMWADDGCVARDQVRRWEAALRRGGLLPASLSLEALILDGSDYPERDKPAIALADGARPS